MQGEGYVNTIDRAVANPTADHLDKSTYYYFITSVDAPRSQVRTSTVVTLQPKSFCFTMLQGDAQLELSGTLHDETSMEEV
ncbi:uncharacterized protein LDX57_010367 [Aspergillus melleus]|uniref:uncharacterized protein n=1 Tax=Aspergillus melleus TaxID=138277 RepID=UPI001E8DC872|nr:uncharacterized protein LDX57_010367 [Aspergillus melleus]KAH8432739.1 hypothetical protein LDX57_010367 [Aspergillus melleus]